jgi:hypothetical protein
MLRRSVLVGVIVLAVSGLFVTPVAAGDKLEVEILGQSDLSPTGTFEVRGQAAEFLCPSGTLESANTRIEWLSEDTFKIWQDKVLTCEGTEQVFVLELKNTIVIGQGGIPGKGNWKLKDSTGFDPAPKGKGEIVVVESEPGVLVEAYVGWVSFK